jgi:hypothetical protein
LHRAAIKGFLERDGVLAAVINALPVKVDVESRSATRGDMLASTRTFTQDG